MNIAQINLTGLDAAKPSTGWFAGRLYFATDSKKIYRDTGSAWVDMGVGGGGTTIAETNMVWVDHENGDDVTGAIGSSATPYATLEAALTEVFSDVTSGYYTKRFNIVMAPKEGVGDDDYSADVTVNSVFNGMQYRLHFSSTGGIARVKSLIIRTPAGANGANGSPVNSGTAGSNGISSIGINLYLSSSADVMFDLIELYQGAGGNGGNGADANDGVATGGNGGDGATAGLNQIYMLGIICEALNFNYHVAGSGGNGGVGTNGSASGIGGASGGGGYGSGYGGSFSEVILIRCFIGYCTNNDWAVYAFYTNAYIANPPSGDYPINRWSSPQAARTNETLSGFYL